MPAILIVSAIMLMLNVSSCKRDPLTYDTTGDVNIYSYLGQRQEEFSLFKQIIDKAGYSSFLNTYGTYTMFATNDAGVTAYLQSQGKSNVDQIDVATAKKIVAVSLIAADTMSSTMFTDGKMRSPSPAGQYLITSVTNVNNASTVVINKQANLVRSKIRLGNGIEHVIDNIL